MDLNDILQQIIDAGQNAPIAYDAPDSKNVIRPNPRGGQMIRPRSWGDSISPSLGDVTGGLAGLGQIGTDAARGSLSALAGAPGDLAKAWNDNTPDVVKALLPAPTGLAQALQRAPGSDAVRQALGGAQKASPYETIGSLDPGVAPVLAARAATTAAKVAPHVAQFAKATGTKLADLTDNVNPTVQATLDWLKDQGGDMASRVNDKLQTLPGAAPAYAVKPRAGNWDPASLDVYLGDLKGAHTGPVGDGATDQARNAAVDAWIDKPLRRYIQTYMGTAEDPLIGLEKEGITHFSDQDALRKQADEWGIANNNPNRVLDGMPQYDTFDNNGPADVFHEQATGRSYRSAWENLSDAHVEKDKNRNDTFERLGLYHGLDDEGAGAPLDIMHDLIVNKIPPSTTNLTDAQAEFYQKSYGWMKPEDQLHYMSRPYDDSLNFGHIGDMLRQSNLTPEQIAKVNVPDAVRMTHKWNQELAAKMNDPANPDNPLNKGISVHKDYGDGFKWVKIGKPDALPEGWKIQPVDADTYYKGLGVEPPVGPARDGADAAPNPEFTGLHLVDDQGNVRHRSYYLDATKHPMADQLGYKPQDAADFRQRAENELLDSYHEKDVGAGLKAEGDTMGHCVGGYCPDVMSGSSSIYSLRDAKGKPHVTIETAPPKFNKADFDAKMDAAGIDENERIERMVRAGHLDADGNPTGQYLSDTSPNIVQIKGKQNAAPVADYLPYVQDFVKSQPWGRVGDMSNAGLVDLNTHITGANYRLDPASEEVQNLVKQHGRYITHSDLNAYIDQTYPTKKARRGYAKGGTVRALPPHLAGACTCGH